MINILIKLSLLPSYLWDMMWSPIYKRCMKSCGKGVYLRPIIGKKVIFGPKPTIITGDHRIDIIGKYIIDVTDKEKLPENDLPVVIEDDVWVGANVTILKGVTIGRGSVVAAGAVVTKSCPPYSIIGGGAC